MGVIRLPRIKAVLEGCYLYAYAIFSLIGDTEIVRNTKTYQTNVECSVSWHTMSALQQFGHVCT